MVAKIRSDSSILGSWVSGVQQAAPSLGATPQSGQTAPLNAAGLAGACASGNILDAETFIKRVVESLQGRVADQRGLSQFAQTWQAKVKQTNCDVERVKPIYEDMIRQIRSDVTLPGSWVAVQGPSQPAPPQSGQTAPLDGSGLAGVCSSSNTMDIETFIGRVVVSLGGRVTNYQGLRDFANSWLAKVKQQNCDVEKVKPLYDEMIAKMRSDAGGLQAWLSVPQAPAGASGQTATLDATGLVGVAASGNMLEMEAFVRRLVESLQGRVAEQRGLSQFAMHWSAMAKQQNGDVARVTPIFNDMVAKIRSDAQIPGGWVAAGSAPQSAQPQSGASPQSGQTAPLNAGGLAGAAATGNQTDVETFIGRVVVSLTGHVKDQRGLETFAKTWMAKVKEQNCEVERVKKIYEDMIAKIRSDVTMPGSWIAVGPAPAGASPQSGQMAPLNAMGFCGSVATGNPSDIESFIGRVVVSLQGRVVDQRGLAQFATTWSGKVKQGNCEVERFKGTYDDMIAKIRQDAQTHGAWVAAQGASSGGAQPQSGQSAPLEAAGLAGAVASGNPMDVETFIRRVVESLQGRVADQQGLQRFANEWSMKVRQENCEVERVKPLYMDMIGQIRSVASTPGGWVAVGGAQPQQSAAASAASAPPQSGQTAPLNAAGLAGACASQNPTDMQTFVGRLVVSLGGRVQQYPQLQQFARDWSAKVKDQNCNAERAAPIYEEMIAKLRSDAQAYPAWLTMPSPSGTPAPAASGQTAPLNAAGLAGTVAANNPMEVETFINRVVTSLGCHIVDQRGFTEFVRTWSTTTRNQNCDVSRVQKIYEEMVVKIRNDAQVPGGWVGMQRSAAAASPQSGNTAPLNASGLAGTVASGNPVETETFIGRVVVSLGCRVVDYNKLREFAGQWSSMTKERNCEVSQVEHIYRDMLQRISTDAQTLGGWVAMQSGGSAASGRAAPENGQRASLDEKGLAGVCVTGNSQDMEVFVGRLSVSLGFNVKVFDTLRQLAGQWSNQVRDQNCEPARVKPIFDEICSRLRRDAQMPGGWVAPANRPAAAPIAPLGGAASPATPTPPLAPVGASAASGGTRAAPLSGQSAPLTAAGFAGVCASEKPTDAQSFVGRLVYDLGCKTAPGRFKDLASLADQWASQAKQQNCVVDRVTPVFNEMVNKIRTDSKVPGSWVLSAKPAGSATPTPGIGTPPAPLAPAGGMATPPAPMAPLGASSSMTPPAPAPLAPIGAPLAPMAPLR